MDSATDLRAEWLETDGLGGFACGTLGGPRTRRYHALLTAASTPPTGRFALVNALDVSLRTPAGEISLSQHRFAPDVTTASPGVAVERFSCDPWPRWDLRLPGGERLVHEVFMTRGTPRTVVTWRLLDPIPGATLRARPLLSGRDYHALHHENEVFRFDPLVAEGRVHWTPYPGVPGIIADHNGRYRHDPVWYRRFEYDRERDRGFDCMEDLAAPGILEFDLSAGEASIVFTASPMEEPRPGARAERPDVAALRAAEATSRAALGGPLDRAADQYIVRGSRGPTIIAGYPWFSDWGRDTFIALRGLCLATGRLDDARDILLAWSRCDSGGVLPNRFPDRGAVPEYNSVDAALWFIIAAYELSREARAAGRPLSSDDEEALTQATQRILNSCVDGTHHNIHVDSDGLLAAGAPGVQLTWMDARVGERVITPRIGKPVEIQALWLNALRIGALWAPKWLDLGDAAHQSFVARFWCEQTGHLHDVVDADHVSGRIDPSLRPNQLLAVGGLPCSLLPAALARRVVDRVEADLLTPLGLRTLSPSHPDYVPRYAGGPEQRDSAYHQGTVWPWLLGPFVDAWVRVRGGGADVRAAARERFLPPLHAHLREAGLGHISEIADADAPHAPNGCPFQAWSVGELLRLERRVLVDPADATKRSSVPCPEDRRARTGRRAAGVSAPSLLPAR